MVERKVFTCIVQNYDANILQCDTRATVRILHQFAYKIRQICGVILWLFDEKIGAFLTKPPPRPATKNGDRVET
jgi:hypothetical protein